MKGFTLLETAVVLAIMGILSAIVLIGWPSTRQHQALLLATEQVQTMVRTAQQKALNEDRAANCLLTVTDDTPEGRRLCSDVGVAVKGSDMVMFADTVDDDQYTVADTGSDFLLEEQTLPLGVTGPTSWQSFLYEAQPPTIGFADGVAEKTLNLHVGTATRQIKIKKYGQVE